MVMLRGALVTPRGIVMPRPLRLMTSPFSEEGAALQLGQPWVGDPSKLTDAQIKRTKALIEAARAAKGTLGTVINPKSKRGAPMPAIAKKVAETISGKLSPEERLARRRAAAEKYRAARRARPEYLAYLARLGAA